ncbi:MAG: hypothetical protein ABI663_23735 [Chryseolinea sp.]
MRTSLNEINAIEQYLNDEFNATEKRVFEERMHHHEALRLNLFLQRKIYRILPFYRRRRIKERAEQIHDQLFHHTENTTFRNSILQLF